MSKYIDSEKLIAEIERMREINRKAFESEHIESGVFHGRTQAINHLWGYITSLQQEQPEVDLVAELKHHLTTTPKEQLENTGREE